MDYLQWAPHPSAPSLSCWTLSDLIDQFTRLIIWWLISQSVLEQLTWTWELPCGRESFGWFVPFLFVWVWFYWIDPESIFESFSHHSRACSKPRLTTAMTGIPEGRRQGTGIISNGSYQGFLSSESGVRLKRALKSQWDGDFSVCLDNTDPWQESANVSIIWNRSVKISIHRCLFSNKQSLWAPGPSILVLITWAFQGLCWSAQAWETPLLGSQETFPKLPSLPRCHPHSFPPHHSP